MPRTSRSALRRFPVFGADLPVGTADSYLVRPPENLRWLLRSGVCPVPQCGLPARPEKQLGPSYLARLDLSARVLPCLFCFSSLYIHNNLSRLRRPDACPPNLNHGQPRSHQQQMGSGTRVRLCYSRGHLRPPGGVRTEWCGRLAGRVRVEPVHEPGSGLGATLLVAPLFGCRGDVEPV